MVSQVSTIFLFLIGLSFTSPTFACGREPGQNEKNRSLPNKTAFIKKEDGRTSYGLILSGEHAKVFEDLRTLLQTTGWERTDRQPSDMTVPQCEAKIYQTGHYAVVSCMISNKETRRMVGVGGECDSSECGKTSNVAHCTHSMIEELAKTVAQMYTVAFPHLPQTTAKGEAHGR